MIQASDLFAEARASMTIADAWRLLGLEGEPKASCRSPFREDRTPSFSIHNDGRSWHDHSTGDGGDVIEFIRHAIRGDHRDVRLWLGQRSAVQHVPQAKTKTAPAPRRIEWPAELLECDRETWTAFAIKRGFTFPAVHAMVKAGILRFCMVDAVKCYVVTDAAGRAAEIRRVDGKLFGQNKAYPLRGVDKSWLPGIELLQGAPADTGVLITEGATDLLAAIDLYTRYVRQHDGVHSWIPAAVLGASCRNLHPEAANLIRGRHVRIVPDGDAAGDKMADYWTGVFRRIGCPVDVVNLDRGTDLSDHLNTLSPPALFLK